MDSSFSESGCGAGMNSCSGKCVVESPASCGTGCVTCVPPGGGTATCTACVCGTATCSRGACVPELIQPSVAAVTGIAVAGTDVFFSEHTAIRRGLKTGCGGAPGALFTNTTYSVRGCTLSSDANYAYFLGSEVVDQRALRFGLAALSSTLPEAVMSVAK